MPNYTGVVLPQDIKGSTVTICPVMTLLEQHVPITLLCDLLSSSDPDSAAINRAERPDRDPIRLEVAEHARIAHPTEMQLGHVV
jgi:hypothetical protein